MLCLYRPQRSGSCLPRPNPRWYHRLLGMVCFATVSFCHLLYVCLASNGALRNRRLEVRLGVPHRTRCSLLKVLLVRLSMPERYPLLLHEAFVSVSVAACGSPMSGLVGGWVGGWVGGFLPLVQRCARASHFLGLGHRPAPRSFFHLCSEQDLSGPGGYGCGLMMMANLALQRVSFARHIPATPTCLPHLIVFRGVCALRAIISSGFRHEQRDVLRARSLLISPLTVYVALDFSVLRHALRGGRGCVQELGKVVFAGSDG